MACREWCLFCNGRDNFTVYDKKSTVGCNFSFLRELFVMIKLCYSKGEMMDYIVAKKDSMSVKIPIGEILYIGTMSDCPRLLQFITDNSKVNSIVCSRRKLTEVLKDWKNL